MGSPRGQAPGIANVAIVEEVGAVIAEEAEVSTERGGVAVGTNIAEVVAARGRIARGLDRGLVIVSGGVVPDASEAEAVSAEASIDRRGESLPRPNPS